MGSRAQSSQSSPVAVKAAHLSYSLAAKPYTGKAQKVSVKPKGGITGMGKISVYYNKSKKAPKKVGSYKVSVSVAGSASYKATKNIRLGTLKIQKSVKLTFNANGGKIGSKKSLAKYVIKGKKISVLPKVPTRANYKFLGWYTSKTGGKKIKAATKVRKNAKYYAHWQKLKPAEQQSDSQPKPPVTPPAIAAASVKLSIVNHKYLVGSAHKTIKLDATVSPANAKDKTVSWTSSNTAVATVSAQGAVTFTDTTGQATITARTANGKTASCVLEALPQATVTKVEFAKRMGAATATQPMKVGDKTRGGAKTTPAGFESSIVWSSSNPAVVAVDPQTGELEAKATGTATITATVAGKTDTLTVTVKPIATAIALTQTYELSFKPNEKFTIGLYVTPQGAFTEYEYSTSDASVAKISPDATGKPAIEALHPGTATITIKEKGSGKQLTISVTVNAPPAQTGSPGIYYYACERQSNGKATVMLDIVPMASAAYDYYYVAQIKNYIAGWTSAQIYADANIIADGAVPKNNPSVDFSDVTPGVAWFAVWAWQDTDRDGRFLEGDDDPVGQPRVVCVPALYKIQNLKSHLMAFPFDFQMPMADMSYGGMGIWYFPITVPSYPLSGTAEWDTVPGAQGYRVSYEFAGEPPGSFEIAQVGTGRQSIDVMMGPGDHKLTIAPYVTNPLNPLERIYGQSWTFTYPTMPGELGWLEDTISWPNS
jgi:uncharacterized repeat protein (TIGR02543 family)